MKPKFGLSVQKKPTVVTSTEYKVRKSKKNANVIPGKLVGFTNVQLNDGTVYPVDRESQSIVGLKKYFREAYGRFIVEKPLEKAKQDIKTCHKYRRGATVKGYINVVEGKEDSFFITGYLEVTT